MVGDKSGTIANIVATMEIMVDKGIDDDNATFVKYLHTERKLFGSTILAWMVYDEILTMNEDDEEW